MGWSASTVYGEASEGSFRALWDEEVENHPITSAFEQIQERRDRRIGSAERRRWKAAYKERRRNTLPPLPTSSGTKHRGKTTLAAELAKGRFLGFVKDAHGRNRESLPPVVVTGGDPKTITTDTESSPHQADEKEDVADGVLSLSGVEERDASCAHASPRSKVLDRMLCRPGLRRIKVELPRVIHTRNVKEMKELNKAHVTEVLQRKAAVDEERAARAGEIVARKRVKELDPMDRASDDEERLALRRSNWVLVACLGISGLVFSRIVERHRAACDIARLCVPRVKLVLHRRKKIELNTVSRWLGRVKRPHAVELARLVTPLAPWPVPNVEALVRCLHLRVYYAGETVSYEGEPATSTLIIIAGTVVQHQRTETGLRRRSLASSQMLRAPAVHGENFLLRPANHFTTLVAQDRVFAWELPRRKYLQELVNVPIVASHEADNNVFGPDSELSVDQVKVNGCFRLWDDADVRQLLATCPRIGVPRHTLIYDVKERGTQMYIVALGTVELVERYQDNSDVQRTLANAGTAFGDEAVLFVEGRMEEAVAATDVVLYKVERAQLIQGLYSNPNFFLSLQRELNGSRARKLSKPPVVHFQNYFPTYGAATFHKLMLPKIRSRGENLPIGFEFIYLEKGAVQREGRNVIRAPAMLGLHEGLDQAMHIPRYRTLDRVYTWSVQVSEFMFNVKGSRRRPIPRNKVFPADICELFSEKDLHREMEGT